MNDKPTEKRERDFDLQLDAMEAIFKYLPLDKQRQLVFRFMEHADIIHGASKLPPVDGAFVKWLCSGKKKFFTTQEAAQTWQLWTFVMANTDCVQRYNDGKTYTYDIHPFGANGDDAGFIWSPDHHFTKSECFDWLLTNTIPEQVYIQTDAEDFEGYRFDRTTSETLETLRIEGWRDVDVRIE